MENLELFYGKHNIVNWEYILLGMTKAKDFEVCKITRKDGSSSFHGDIQALLRRLDRQDLRHLYSLVQERFKDHSLEGHDLDLWGDLRIGVHSLFLDGTSIQINMLVEKRYPLKKAILEKMINLKIEAEEDSNMAIELIKFIKSQIAEQNLKLNHKFRGGLLGIKELLQDNVAEGLNAASYNSTDNAKISRKRSKNQTKHERGNGRARKELGESFQKTKSQLKSKP
ncbi:hypothetical protein Tco_1412976 [Tanacetum coccineum]